MKKIQQPVNLSGYSCTISFIISAVLIALFLFNVHKDNVIGTYIFLVTIILMMFTVLLYMPITVKVDEKKLSICRSLRIKNIPLAEIDAIKHLAPTIGERRICGSGGFFGYWGWFSERDTGKYFAYYGKASDCFLITLKNGRKYLIGCKNHDVIVDFITDRIKH